MSVITAEHEALQDATRGWLGRHCPPAVPRACHDDPAAPVPDLLADAGVAAELGWLGLHVAEEYGGAGYGLPELSVVLAEAGRALLPGPLLPTAWYAALLQEAGTPRQCAALLRPLLDGNERAAVALDTGTLHATGNDGGLTLDGTLRPVLAAGSAHVVLVPAAVDGGPVTWCAVDRGELTVRDLPSVDPTRPMAEIVVADVAVPADRQFPDLSTQAVRDVGALLFAGEAVGVAEWCLRTAVDYAKVREQFGRPIGMFQAVKHKCTDMLLATERLRAAVWDAARSGRSGDQRSLAVAIAAATAGETVLAAAKDSIQLLGGVGYTWEHDAHLYLKRAMALHQLVGPASDWWVRTAELAGAGVRRELRVELDDGSDALRDGIRRVAGTLADADPLTQRRTLVDEGLLVPYWPAPWGRGAGPTEQLVIADELRAKGILSGSATLSIGAWVLPTLIEHGTPEQQQRWIRPTMYGELSWCQLFSEPGAGSDLASLSTKAVRVEGGWRLTGQKVWTSLAREADWGICLARTDPGVPKHDGITCFLVDMTSPGIDIRPLRELTGHAMFNEVYLTDVVVADDCVVGAVNDGWRVGRTTLANERVSMGAGSSFGKGVEALLGALGEHTSPHDRVSVGRLLGEGHVLGVLAHRTTLRALAGRQPGAESSVGKLLGVEHSQRVQELGLGLLGAEGTVAEGEAARWQGGFLGNRCLTIAGGTSEIQRNLIAERLLGLPRDADAR